MGNVLRQREDQKWLAPASPEREFELVAERLDKELVDMKDLIQSEEYIACPQLIDDIDYDDTEEGGTTEALQEDTAQLITLVSKLDNNSDKLMQATDFSERYHKCDARIHARAEL